MSFNPASDRTARRRYCLTEGQGKNSCCDGPQGPPGPSGAAGPAGPSGPPGTLDISGALWQILYSNGASGVSASPFFTYDILNDRLAAGQGTAGLKKTQTSINQIAIGTGAGASQSSPRVIAIGANAGFTQSGLEAIAIGYNAGYVQSTNADRAIAIGSYAGQSQTASSIILNASGAIGATTDLGRRGFFVNPIRAVSTTTFKPIYYDISTNEIIYNTATMSPFPGYVAGVFEVTSDPTVSAGVLSIIYNTASVATGGLALASPSTNIILPVVGIYEITSILQCSTSSTTTISAWHLLTKGSIATQTPARTVTVPSGEFTILTIISMVQTVATTNYFGLQVYSPGTVTLETGSVGTSPDPTNPAVITTVKLVG